MAMGPKPLRRLVDLVGIEPTTSSMPWKRAPSCATGPQGRDNSLIVVARGRFVNRRKGAETCRAKATEGCRSPRRTAHLDYSIGAAIKNT